MQSVCERIHPLCVTLFILKPVSGGIHITNLQSALLSIKPRCDLTSGAYAGVHVITVAVLLSLCQVEVQGSEPYPSNPSNRSHYRFQVNALASDPLASNTLQR